MGRLVNKLRPFGPIRQEPPEEYEQAYHRSQQSPAMVAGLN